MKIALIVIFIINLLINIALRWNISRLHREHIEKENTFINNNRSLRNELKRVKKINEDVIKENSELRNQIIEILYKDEN